MDSTTPAHGLRAGEPTPPPGPQVPACPSCMGCREWGGNGLWHHFGCSKIPKGHGTAWLEKAPVEATAESALNNDADPACAAFYQAFDGHTQQTGHKPTAFDVWLLAKGLMGTDGRRLVGTPSPEMPTVWRCFHCDAVFTDREQAELHFGRSETQRPACDIDIAHVRWLEEQHRRALDEDTEVLRTLSGLQSEHERLRRRAEEEGYARGLADAKRHPQELGLQPIPHQEAAGAQHR